jgi:hypothetical protein
LKVSNKLETSLPIVEPDAHASGIVYHQLAALVARLGGIARIVWDNGGEIGILGNDTIMAAHAIYEASLQSEMRGKGKGVNGARSIRWAGFQTVDYANIGGVVCIDWLKVEAGQ